MDPFTMSEKERKEMTREWFVLFLTDKVDIKLYVRILLWLDYDDEEIVRAVKAADRMKMDNKQ